MPARFERTSTGATLTMAKAGMSRVLSGGVLIAAVLALTLAGCGRRGALDRPGQVDPAVSGPGQAAPATAPAQPDRPFVLDAII